MTIEEIRATDKAFLVPADVAPVLRCHPHTINLAAKLAPAQLGFPVCVVGRRVKIPTVGFLRWYEGRTEART